MIDARECTPEWATHPVLDLNDYLKPGRSAWSDKFHDSPHVGAENVCCVCGRLVNPERGVLVCLGLGGSGLLHPDDDEAALASDAGYMGLWMVGPECGKGVPEAYRVGGQP